MAIRQTFLLQCKKWSGLMAVCAWSTYYQNRQALSGDKGQREVGCASWHNSSSFDASSIIIQERNKTVMAKHHSSPCCSNRCIKTCHLVSHNKPKQHKLDEAIRFRIHLQILKHKKKLFFQHCSNWLDLTHLVVGKRSTRVLHPFLRPKVLVPYANTAFTTCQNYSNLELEKKLQKF